jgi:3-(3-hydroxy-phenyl)propionate hydroxylase
VTRPGSSCPDAPLDSGFLLERLGGGFVLLSIGADAPAELVEGVPAVGFTVPTPDVSVELRTRYLGDAASAVYLIRPDQHVAARWAAFDETAVRGALRRATGRL